MIINTKNAAVIKMAEEAVRVLDLFREATPNARTAQFIRCTDILIFCNEFPTSATVQISLEDFKALKQLPTL